MDASDIQKRLSGGVSNNAPDASLGGEMSNAAIADNTLQNLFDNVSASERTSGMTDYRCFYFTNAHATETLETAILFIQQNTPAADTAVAIGLDPAGIGDGVATGVAAVIPDEDTAPAGVAFSTPDSGSPLAVGDLGPGEGFAVWVRRVVDPGAAPASGDPFILRVQGTPV